MIDTQPTARLVPCVYVTLFTVLASAFLARHLGLVLMSWQCATVPHHSYILQPDETDAGGQYHVEGVFQLSQIVGLEMSFQSQGIHVITKGGRWFVARGRAGRWLSVCSSLLVWLA